MASLLGRNLRSFIVMAVLWAVTVVNPASAAPFAAIVMDARSGEVLYEKNADARLHPASLTKMMTLYIVFQEVAAGRISLDDKVTVSKNAAGQAPSRLGLKPGQKIAVRYLIRAAAVKSANDAAMALGEHVSGSQEAFAKRMTKTARALGMKNSTFKNPNGLTAEGHLSTARDMNLLGRHLFYDFPQFYNIFSRRTADAGMATVTNTNSRFLDAYEGADGIKTGYTVPAGFNLTASAQRGNKRIIATVFGGTSTAARNAKMKELMDLGFGAARNNAREKVPEAAPLPESKGVADALASIDEPDVPGSSAKTIRVTGQVVRSLRPKARPGAAAAEEVLVAEVAEIAEVPDEVALAIAASVEGALDEVLPAPEGTLQAQAEKLATEDLSLADTAADPVEDLVETATVTAPAGTLEAQAQELAATPAEPEPMVMAEAVGTDAAEAALEEPVDLALAAARPVARPAEITAPVADVVEAPAPEPVLEQVQVADATPAVAILEEVVPADVAIDSEDSLLADAALDDDTPVLTDVETVAAAIMAPMPDAAPIRNAPIFESVTPEVTVAEAEPAVEEVIVVKSTSGGRHWGVNVGDYTSRSAAERALLKTALTESATLNEGLRKITQKGGSYHANFMGLTEDQADLACRRLQARGVSCETLGP
ncbi:MAG: serine hydrolase [Paracoccaceae bacterium]